jgi:hypothetical protein
MLKRYITATISLSVLLGAQAANTGLLIYQQINFGGQSYSWPNPETTACVTVPGPWQNDLSSLIVQGDILVNGYTAPGCVGNSVVTFNGQIGSYPDLSPYNNQILSFAVIPA